MHTLLIVEDEKMIRQGIKAMIRRSGVVVDNILECANGLMALEILYMQRVDVMITDIHMPKMDGIELVKAMQKLKEPPLTVVISGYDEFSYAVEMLRLGVKEYILKPVDREKIKEVLVKLDKQLDRIGESRSRERSIGYQQLKYLILNEHMTEHEKEILEDCGPGEICEGYYAVCCLNNTGGLPYEDETCVYLSDVAGEEIYIVRETELKSMELNEFMNRCVGISSISQGLKSLRRAWQEAKSARKEAFFLNRPIVHYEKMVMGEKKYQRLNIEENKIQRIVQMLGTDKWEEAVRQLGRIFKNVSLGSYPLAVVENAIRLLLDQTALTYQNVIPQLKADISQFYGLEDYADLDEWLMEFTGWIEQLHDTIYSRIGDDKNRQKMEKAIAYIRENYDKELNMAVVSNFISMNYSLFSYTFKQYAGQNFVAYLKEIRIKKARQLLEETDMKIMDISQAVGCENEKHFMKIFKSECGVSPTEYRKNLQFRE